MSHVSTQSGKNEQNELYGPKFLAAVGSARDSSPDFYLTPASEPYGRAQSTPGEKWILTMGNFSKKVCP